MSKNVAEWTRFKKSRMEWYAGNNEKYIFKPDKMLQAERQTELT